MCGMPPKAAGGVAQRLEVGVGVEASARCIMSDMAEAEVGKVDLAKTKDHRGRGSRRGSRDLGKI